MVLPIAETTTTTPWPALGVSDDAPGDVPDLLGVGDRGATVLLDDQSHGRLIARAMLPHGPHAFKRGAPREAERCVAPGRLAARDPAAARSRPRALYDPQVTALILIPAAALVVALWGPRKLVRARAGG